MAKDRFDIKEREGVSFMTDVIIIVDKETGVNYLFVHRGYGGGLTPLIDADGKLSVHNLSPEGEMQVVIMPEQWFAAELPGKKGFSLVGCAVGPAFSFENFELAKKSDLLKQYPQHKELIERLSKD